MVSAKGIIGAFVTVIIGVALLPTVVSMSTNNMTNGSAAAIQALYPLVFVIIILAAAASEIIFM